jgi:hypothetical protein
MNSNRDLQNEEAERIACGTPGIWSADKELMIEYNYELAY